METFRTTAMPEYGDNLHSSYEPHGYEATAPPVHFMLAMNGAPMGMHPLTSGSSIGPLMPGTGTPGVLPMNSIPMPAYYQGYTFHPEPLYTPQMEPDCFQASYPQSLSSAPFLPIHAPPQNMPEYPPGPEYVLFPPEHTFSNSVDLIPKQSQRCRIVRGISSGGSITRPPKPPSGRLVRYLPVRLQLNHASLQEMCWPVWNSHEFGDARRIIRIERFQYGAHIVANFSILGSAVDHPETYPAPPGADVLEVSCLECLITLRDELDDSQDDRVSNHLDVPRKSYYITSVEVLRIVELLLGTRNQDAADKRKERGRIRSNLVPFWSRRPISSRSHSGYNSSPEVRGDFRLEMARRIMGYECRKPRGFDKEVRILKWEKLIPALMRALQCYYAELT